MISTCLNGQTGPQRFYPGLRRPGLGALGLQPPDRLARPRAARSVRHHHRLAVAALRRAAARHRAAASRAAPARASTSTCRRSRAASSVSARASPPSPRTATVLGRIGNRSRHAAPHGVFRCADEDGRERWIAIAVHDDADWQRLVGALGTPAWARDAGARDRGRPARARRRRSRRDSPGGRATQHAPRARRDAPARRRRRRAGRSTSATCTTIRSSRTAGTSAPSSIRCSGAHPAETHAIRFSDMEPALRRPAPKLGEHTDARAARPARHVGRRDRPPACRRRARLNVRPDPRG